VFTVKGNFLLILAVICVTIFSVMYKHTLYQNTDNIYTTRAFVFDITFNFPAQTLLTFVLAAFVAKYYGYLTGAVICVNGLFYVCKTQTTNRMIQNTFTKKMKERNYGIR
jgi:ABC-type Co2+ transport system permease subunit